MILYLQFQVRKFSSIITDNVATLSSGSLTNAVNGTFSGTVQAEHFKTTDDLTVGDDASIGEAIYQSQVMHLFNGNTTLVE